MTQLETRILNALLDGPREVVQPTPPVVASLCERGYTRMSDGRLGPLGIRDGSKFVGLTEAGRIATNPARRGRGVGSEWF